MSRVLSLTHIVKNQSCFICSQESELLAHTLSLSGSKQAFADLSPRYRLDLWIWEGSAQLSSPTSQAAWAPKMETAETLEAINQTVIESMKYAGFEEREAKEYLDSFIMGI